MRTSLFLSSLFAVSLVGGVALADSSRGHSDPGRSHGDQVDKSYSTPSSHAVSSSSARTAAPAPYGSNSKSPLSKTETDRINCAPDAEACGHSGHAARAPQGSQGTPATGAKSAPAKNPMHQRESQRVNCSDGDDCTASSKASKALSGGAKTGASTSVQNNATANRKDAQVSVRMACDDSGECSMSSKDAQKFWRAEAFKAGTASSSKDLALEDFQRAEKQKMEHEKYEKPSAKPAKERNRDAAHNPTPDHE